MCLGALAFGHWGLLCSAPALTPKGSIWSALVRWLADARMVCVDTIVPWSASGDPALCFSSRERRRTWAAHGQHAGPEGVSRKVTPPELPDWSTGSGSNSAPRRMDNWSPQHRCNRRARDGRACRKQREHDCPQGTRCEPKRTAGDQNCVGDRDGDGDRDQLYDCPAEDQLHRHARKEL